jgi:uncharacterized protein YdhG (YjbR/CyaY superfamily)
VKTDAKNADDYLAQIDPDRRAQLETLRRLIKRCVPAATEGILWGMIGFAIGERPFVALASHKSYLSLYLMDLYTQPGLREKHAAALAKLRMGKSCINFDTVEELPLDAIAEILRAAPSVVVSGGTMASIKAKTDSKTTKTKAIKKPRKR